MDRDPAYSILSDLVFKGFLATETLLGGCRFVFKTINESEFNLIRALAGNPEDIKYQTRFNIYLLLYSTFSIEGRLCLNDEKDPDSELYRAYEALPWQICNSLILKLNETRKESMDALDFLEGFTYTYQSRRMWKVLGNRKDPSSDHFTGIPGTSRMGLNFHQQNWVYINSALDEEEEYNNQYNFSLLIASASNPKGVRQIKNRHDSTVQRVEDRRKKLAQDGKPDRREWAEDEWAATTDTVEELVGELERQMTGVKDRHDRFIEEHLRKMREKAEKRAREAAERIRRAREGTEGLPLISGRSEPLTPEETEILLLRRRHKTTVSVGDENIASKEEKDRFLKKVSGRVLTSK